MLFRVKSSEGHGVFVSNGYGDSLSCAEKTLGTPENLIFHFGCL